MLKFNPFTGTFDIVNDQATTTILGVVNLATAAEAITGTDAVKVITPAVLTSKMDTDATLSGNSDLRIASQKAVKTYVDNAASGAGLSNKGASRLATVAALPANLYNNGASGVGATLTGISVGALSIDGTAVALNDRVIIKDEAAQANNGIYTVTTLGTALVVYVLTRVTNMDTTTEIGQAYSYVTAGSANINTSWNVNYGTYTVGTTAIVWNQFSASPTFIAGDGLTLTGSTFSVNVDGATLEITADALNVKNLGITGAKLENIVSGATVGDATHIPIITFDNKGRITGTTTATITVGASETFAFFQGN